MFTKEEYETLYQPKLSDIQHREARIWVFPTDHPSPFLDGEKIFTCGETTLSIIDHYRGRGPWLLNFHYALGMQIDVNYIPTVILDSHIVSYLRDYANNNENMPRSRKRAVQQLLDFLVIRKWDYNPAYYWLEAAKESASEGHVRHIRECTEAIFRLHNMDKDHFLNTGQVVLDQRRVQAYFDEYNVHSLEEAAASVASDLIFKEPLTGMKSQAALSYAALLQMILIETNSRTDSLVEKIRALHEFVDATLKISVARELLTAIFYFTGQSGKLIPRLQSNSKREEFLSKLRSASWDLTLLRLPEALFAFPPTEPTPISFVCTGERALQRIGRHLQIVEIRCIPPVTKVATSMIGLDMSELSDFVSQSTADELHELNMASYSRLSQSRSAGHIAAIQESELANLTAELEDRVRKAL